MMVILAMLVVIGAAVPMILIGNKPKREQEAFKQNAYKRIYRFLIRNFVTQKSVRGISAKISSLSVYKKTEIYLLTTQYFLLSWGAALALILFAVFMFKDMVMVLICIAFGVLLNRTLIDKQIDNQYFKVLVATSNALGSIRQEYMKSNSIVEAVNEADIDDILKKPFDELYTILTATDAEIRLQEFYTATPFRTLQTLFGICYNINNQGDTKDMYGQSNFVQALTTLTTDVNAEITKITTQKKKFGIIEYLTFVPIVAMGFLESYFTSIMPGTALIYGGPIGYISKVITVFSAIICYSIISGINKNIPVKENDQSEWALKLLANPGWRNFIDNLKVKNKKAGFLGYRLKGALSRQSIEEVYTKKVVTGIVTFFVAVFVLNSALVMGSDYIKNSTQQLSLVATNEMDKFEKETILALDFAYFKQRDEMQPNLTVQEEVTTKVNSILELVGLKPRPDRVVTYDLTDEAITAMVQSYLPGLSDLQVIDQVKRVRDKYDNIQNATFKWWMLWLCLGVGYLGWKAPEIQLKIRRILVKTEAEDDFLQLQALVGILMTTDMDTLDVLGELSQHSRIHKDMLTYCYHSFPANPELELTRLQAKTPLMEFKRFIGKLQLTINDLSLKEAFSDLLIEREQIMRLREITINATIDKKRGLCGPLSLTPLGLMVIGSLLIPLGYLGYMEFMNALTMM